MPQQSKRGGGPTSPGKPSDGSINYKGYSIPQGPAQHDDMARLRGKDPKAPYLIVSRYEGDEGVCRRWPDFAAQVGLGDMT